MTTVLPIALIAGSILIYQIGQKALPSSINHWHALMIYYGAALLIVICMALFDKPDKTLLEGIKHINWAVFLVILGIVGIELGWILAFRAGSDFGTTGIVVNAIVAVLVIPINVWFFKGQFSLTNLAGIAFCLIGLLLITRK